MRNRATAATTMVATCVATRSAGGSSGVGRPRGTSPTVATPWSARSNTRETTSPPTTSTSAPGTLGATTWSVDHDGQRADTRRRASASGCSPRPLHPADELAPAVRAVAVGPGQLRQLADDDVDRRPEQEAGDHRPWTAGATASPACSTAATTNSSAGEQRDGDHELRGLLPDGDTGEHARRSPRWRPAPSSARSRSAATCRTRRRSARRPPRRTARARSGRRRSRRSRAPSGTTNADTVTPAIDVEAEVGAAIRPRPPHDRHQRTRACVGHVVRPRPVATAGFDPAGRQAQTEPSASSSDPTISRTTIAVTRAPATARRPACTTPAAVRTGRRHRTAPHRRRARRRDQQPAPRR